MTPKHVIARDKMEPIPLSCNRLMIEVAPCLLSRNAVGPHMERFDDRYNTHTSLEEKFDNPSNAGNNKNENLELRCICLYACMHSRGMEKHMDTRTKYNELDA